MAKQLNLQLQVKFYESHVSSSDMIKQRCDQT